MLKIITLNFSLGGTPMKKKFIIIMLIFLFIPTLFLASILYEPLDQDTFAIVNGEKLSTELLNSRSQVLYILLDLKDNYPDFYSGLTNTATGVEFLNTYLIDQAMKISNEVLFIQFVEQKGVNLNRNEVKSNIESKFSETFKELEIQDDEIEKYLLYLGYTSRINYIDDAFYSTLYINSISALYNKVLEEIELSDDEVKVEYENNKSNYMSPPTADIKVLIFSSEEEASFTYSRIIDGYYTFDEVYRQSDNPLLTIRIDDDTNSLVKIIKSNPPGYVFGPVLYDSFEGTYALVKIEKKNPARILTFEEANPQIIFNLKDKKAQEYFDKVLPKEFQDFQERSTIIFNSALF
jgi:hypothetical protein